MGKHHSVLLSALVLAVLTFVVHTEAGAFADGSGGCSTTELNNKDCGNLGGNVMEFLGTAASTCSTFSFGGVPCTAYFYKFTGSATSQVNISIPKKVMTKFTSADNVVVGCNQLITDGSGDPTTGFGKNQVTENVCRITVTLTAFPSSPPGTNVRIQADPSSFDPLSWQQKAGNSVTAAAINGPGIIQAAVAETGATLQTSDGVTCSYTTAGGGVSLVACPTGSVVPINQTKLCLPTISGTPSFYAPGGAPYTCETVSFATEGCDIKTTGTDPCRYVGGVCVRY